MPCAALPAGTMQEEFNAKTQRRRDAKEEGRINKEEILLRVFALKILVIGQ
jgi:hypothetical protein